MVPVTLVFTKVDRLDTEKVMETATAHSHVFRQFDVVSPLTLLTSSHKNFGIQELKDHINFRCVVVIELKWGVALFVWNCVAYHPSCYYYNNNYYYYN